jgi:hypothetical protein
MSVNKDKHKQKIEDSLSSAPDDKTPDTDDIFLLDEEIEEGEKRDDTAELYRIDGVIQACVYCQAQLLVKEVKFDLKRCKNNDWEEPTEFVCKEKKCQEFRRAVSGVQDKESSDAVSDFKALNIRPDGGIVSVSSDFFDDETPRLALIRAGKPVPVIPKSVYVPQREKLKESLTVEPVDADRIAKATVIRDRLRKEKGKFFDRANMSVVKTHAPDNTPENLRNQWLIQLDEEKRAAEEQGRLFINGVKTSECRESGTIDLREPEDINLRLACKKSTRDLANLISNEVFCRPIAAPHKVGRKPRTPKMTTVLTPFEVDFYETYAAGHMPVLEMVEKFGAWSDEEIRELENKILVHAYKVGLIAWPSDDDGGESKRYRNYDLENKLISKTSGGSIGGGVHRGKLNDDGQPLKLNSFRTLLPEKNSRGWATNSDNGAPAEDGYGEEDSA